MNIQKLFTGTENRAKEGNWKNLVYHRFQNDNNGNFHWNGSTNGETKSGAKRRIPIQRVPDKIKKS